MVPFRVAPRVLLAVVLAAAAGCKVGRRGPPPSKPLPPAALQPTPPMPAAAPASSDRKLPAFRGAEGFGATTPGGRGGRVLRVTTLADSGPGSLRAALGTRGPRIVVFAVSGVIDDERPLCIEEPFVTVAGQTAPGDGITLAGEELRIQAHDVVLRHLRVRTGDARTPHDGWDNRDAVNFGHPRREGDTHDVVLDHCSFSWAVDETLTVWYRSHDIRTAWGS